MSEDKGIISMIADAVTGAGGALKGAIGAAREIQKMQVDYSTKEKTYDLLDKLMDAQQQQLSLQELLMTAKNRIIELEGKVNAKADWDEQKSQYSLFYPSPSTVVYRLNASAQSDENTHYLCTNCYNSGVKSVLQYKTSSMANATFVCHNCSAEFKFPLEYMRG